MSVPRAAALGAALSVVNPKNLLALLLAGLVLGWSGLSVQAVTTSAAAFCRSLPAPCSCPCWRSSWLATRLGGRLGAVRDWLVRHHARVVSLLLVAIGSMLVIRGLSGT